MNYTTKKQSWSFVRRCKSSLGNVLHFKLFLIFFFLTPHLFAQQQLVTGTVIDTTGEPIIGASVIEKDTSNGVITDLNGQFSLSVKPNAILKISYMGYTTQEIKVPPSGTMEIRMKEDTQLLDELVVVGFGTQKKVNLTGAVGTLAAEELKERPVANVTQALQGLIPGLNIDVSAGSLESRPSINVRGTTTIGQGSSGSPLILVDGMEAELHSINPQDIANISVLKDAAASSIYGSRAPFGVILITTKSGGTAGKTEINYNNSFRSSSPINKKHMMNSVDFATWVNDMLTNRGENIRFGEEYMNRIETWHNAKPYSNGQRITADGTIVYALEPNASGQWNGAFSSGADDIDYYDVVYRDHNFSQEHNISANGGTKKFNYYVSGSYYGTNGLLKMGKENLNRYTATAKVGSELTDWLKLNMNIRFTREDYERPAALTDWFYESLGYKAWPILPLYDRNGNYFHGDDTAVARLVTGGKDSKQSDLVYLQTGFIIEPIKNWLTHIDFNYRIKAANRHWDSFPITNYDIDGNPYFRNSNSNVHEDFLKENYYNFNIRSEYSLTLNDSHNFHLLGGFQAENLKQTAFGLQRNGIMVDSKPEVDLTNGLDGSGKPITPSVNGGRNEWSVAGFFGRFNYDYLGRYLLEVNVRADGSSRFRKGNQWRTFPSVSVGWNIAREEFFKPLTNTIDLLKLRASYGSLGNQNTNNWYYTYLTMNASSSNGSWLQNGAKPNTASAPGLVSESLTWEKIETYNIGVDWGLLRNRLTGSFDYYVRNTKDMIGNSQRLPAILGTNVPQTNNTDLQTKGWELSIMWRDVLKNGFSYSAKFLLSDSRTKITRYPNNPTEYIYTYIENRYINEIWGYETAGLAKSDEEMLAHLEQLDKNYEQFHGMAPTIPLQGQNGLGSDWKAGDIMYKDINGDGIISGGSETQGDSGDVKVIGNHTPRLRFGLDLNAAWKGFDIRVFFQGIMKRDYWQGSSYMFGVTGGGLWGSSGLTTASDYFRNENTWSVKEGYKAANINAYLPRPMQSGKNLNTQTRYLQNASYIRLKNLQVGYTLPTQLTEKFGVQRIRFYISGENLWTGTNLVKQFDPETIGTSGGNGYPLFATLSGGLSLTF